MAVYSMTGYANASAEGLAAAGTLSVEARSVNGRFLDLSLKLPDEVRALEPALRELLTNAFKRGKIELRVSGAKDNDGALPMPTSEQFNRLLHVQGSVQGWMPQARALSVNEVLNWCRNAAPAQKLDEPTLQAAKRCIQLLQEARAREGERLATMLLDRVRLLRSLAAQVAPLLPKALQRQQQKFVERWKEALTQVQGGAAVPESALHERAAGEAAAYAVRIDVAEELSRLRSHLDEIERLIKAGGEMGKRLEFLIQELQREANTLGSKSAVIELTNLSVDMKVAIEQMREQVQNIE
jgi:uncharacterized protein (TIGR00255 family)